MKLGYPHKIRSEGDNPAPWLYVRCYPCRGTLVLADAVAVYKPENPFYTKAKELPKTGVKENPFYAGKVNF